MRRCSLNCPMWACDLCHNRSNPTIVNICLICQASRPRYRFGICLEGKYYVCKLKNKKFVPSVSVSEVSTQMFETFTLKLESSEGSVEENIMAAILEHKRNQMEAPVSVDVHPGVMATPPETVSEEILPTVEGKDNTPDLVPVLAESPRKASTKQKATTDTLAGSVPLQDSLLGMFDPGMSLFDAVMHNAKSFAYDGKIGQYISVDTIRGNDDGSDQVNTIKKELGYIELMRKEQVVMKQVVQEVVKRRADDTYLYDTHADLDINRNEWDKTLECSMCERVYPKSQMPGQISFKAIANWKAVRGAPFPESDYRLTRGRQLEATKLCCFCTQFFDRNAVDLVDKQAIKDMVGIGQISLNGPLNCSNTVYKKLFRRAVDSQKDLEDRPLSRMRHRVALDALRMKAQNKKSDARFIFNPKAAHMIVDQEKVGKFLRKKYCESPAAVALLSEVKQKKSNKVALKPVTGSSAAADDSAQLVGSNPASNAPLSNASSGSRLLERRSLSAGVRRSVGSSNSLVRQKSTGTAASSSIGVNNKKTLSLASSQQTVASSVEIEKMVDSLDGSLHGGKKKVKVAFAPEVDVCEPPGFANVSPKKRKMKKQGSLNGGAVPVPVVKERKPLILKVSASTVVGCDELGKVIEIELQSATGKLMQNGQAGGTAENEKLGVKDTTGVSTRSSVELSQSLKGLFQNMKLRRKEHVSGPVVPLSPTQALSADDEAERLEQDHNSSSTYPVANESQVPSKPKKKELPSQENRAQQQPSVTAKSSALLPAIHKKVHLPGVKANSYHSTVEVQQQNLKKVQVTAVAVGGSHAHVSPVASWKQNVNKPVLRDVFDGSSGKHRDKSYITQVPRNDDFTIDENYEDDHSVNSVHSVPSTHSVPVAEDANNTQRSRADSYDDPCELDDDFEVDTTEPGATSWEGAGSMDQYNWVSAGPYVPSAGDGTIDEEAESNNNNGFSPVNLEASLGALPMDRMKLLSRGSAGGFMTPLSRKGARAFSGHRTPSRGAMLLASPGGAGGVGSGAYTSVAYFEQDGYGLRDNSNSNNNHSSVHSRSSRGSRFSGSSTSGFAMQSVATPSSATARRHLHHNTAETAKPAIAASKVVIVRKMEHARKVDAEVGVEGVIDLDVAAIKPRRRERH